MSAMVWILIGIILIVSELLATSVIAVFFGIAAIIVGLLLQLGTIESVASQFTIFGAVSLLSLFTVRARFKAMFKGYLADKSQEKPNFQHDIGERAFVVEDFSQGNGRITLNGVSWSASSTENLKAGEAVWVVANDGIDLIVSKNKLQS